VGVQVSATSFDLPADAVESVAKALGFGSEPRPLEEGVVTRNLRGHVELRGMGAAVEELPNDINFRIQVTRVGSRVRVIIDTQV